MTLEKDKIYTPGRIAKLTGVNRTKVFRVLKAAMELKPYLNQIEVLEASDNSLKVIRSR